MSENNPERTTQIKTPGLVTGLLVGAIATPALIALFFLGERFAGLPFVPFDLFDWVARNLPGDILTAGIDVMVDTLIALGFGSDLDSTAKIAERVMALGMFWAIGVVFSGILFLVLRQIKAKSALPGVVAGLIPGLPLIAISFAVNISATAGDALSLIWMLLLFTGFGLVVASVYMTLYTMAQADEKQKLDASVVGLNRRQFLIQAGGAGATLTVVGAGLGALLGAGETDDFAAPINIADADPDALPNASDPVTPAPGTRRELTPVRNHYRIDTVSGALPSFDEAEYVLPITGLVANEVEWTLDDIRDMPSITEYITMSCISNRVAGSLISTTKWTGVSFQHILEQLDPDENAKALKITGAGNFDEFVDMDLIRNDERIMLCYAWDDEPLPQRNGFPLRIHIPDRYGMKQPKWIESIEVMEEWEEGYWVRRNWSRDAIVNATSVIDTVATDAIYEEDGKMYVPIGGMAWAGDRGISKVEVRTNGGEWQEAQLRTPLSGRAWTIWRHDWEFNEGTFLFEVRCTEEDGTEQIATNRGVRPDGATGIHSTRETVALPEPEADATAEAENA